jgi:hypothetical protein
MYISYCFFLFFRQKCYLFSALGTTPLTATAAMPGSTMKIFYGEPGEGAVAENVKIGDPLSLVVSIDEQVCKADY